MYTVHYSKQFKKSLDKLRYGGVKRNVLDEIQEVIILLSQGANLPFKYRDHALQGKMKDLRECHIQGDLLLVYHIDEGVLVLTLLDVGSHAYLFG